MEEKRNLDWSGWLVNVKEQEEKQMKGNNEGYFVLTFIVVSNDHQAYIELNQLTLAYESLEKAHKLNPDSSPVMEKLKIVEEKLQGKILSSTIHYGLKMIHMTV